MTQNNQQKDASKGVNISLEFFPPASSKMENVLWRSLGELTELNPLFVSVTYGAGGSTRERTHNTITRILSDTDLKPAAHLTCVGATKDEVNVVIRAYKDAGVKHIVALRGDPPEGLGAAYAPYKDGYENAADLVRGIRNIDDFEVSVSAYPEKHPESKNLSEDLDMLKSKLDAGASRAITQFFFSNEHYYRYLDAAHKAGIFIPIVPGIVPIGNFARISDFAGKCGTSIPDSVCARFSKVEGDKDAARALAVEFAVEQIDDLKAQGVNDFHFYTMNRSGLINDICKSTGFDWDNS